MMKNISEDNKYEISRDSSGRVTYTMIRSDGTREKIPASYWRTMQGRIPTDQVTDLTKVSSAGPQGVQSATTTLSGPQGAQGATPTPPAQKFERTDDGFFLITPDGGRSRVRPDDVRYIDPGNLTDLRTKTPGPQGAQATPVPTGPQGAQATPVPTGPQGAQASQGPTGPTGPQGVQAVEPPKPPKPKGLNIDGIAKYARTGDISSYANYLNKTAPKPAGAQAPQPAPVQPVQQAALGTSEYDPRRPIPTAGIKNWAKKYGPKGDSKLKYPTPNQQSLFKQLGMTEAYDVVLDYLLSEGHADTVEEAHYVMLQMTSEHVQDIVEGKYADSVTYVKGTAPVRASYGGKPESFTRETYKKKGKV